MRICIVNEFFYPDMQGGTGMLLSDAARGLKDRFGYEIDVLTTPHLYRDVTAKLDPSTDWDGIRITRLDCPNFNRSGTPRRLLGNLIFTRKVLKELRARPKYDAVLVGTAPPTVPEAAMAYARRSGVPYIYIIYDLEPDRVVKMGVMPEASVPVRVLRNRQRRWLHSAAKVMVIGRCMRSYLKRHYGVTDAQVEVVPLGADANRIVPASKDTEFRREHGLTGFLVVYGGNFGKYHNFDVILDAAKTLAERDPDVRFALVGNGAQEDHIKARIRDEGISNVVVLPILSQARVPELMASADLLLVTLEPNMEGLCVPSKFYPILSAGRPTLAAVGAESEIALVVEESGVGIRVAQDDRQAFVDAILRLKQDPAEAEAMGARARHTLLEKYTNDRNVENFDRMIRGVVGR